MEHFVAYQNSRQIGALREPPGRLHVQSRKHGHLLRALNNKVWIISGARSGGRTIYELHGVYIAATISEAPSGELVIDGSDGFDFEPPITMNDLTWFDLVRDSRSNLRTGFNRITDDSIIDRLLEIEHRARSSRRKRPRTNEAGVSPSPQPTNDDAITRQGSKRDSGLAQRENAAMQERAMTFALEYYRLRWKNVEDVSSREAYDIHCDDPKGRVLTVKVKGTTRGWETLLLTAAEEQHARARFPDVALFILHDISVVENAEGDLVGRGGTTHVIDPWDITVDELSPLIFGCRLARSRSAKQHAR